MNNFEYVSYYLYDLDEDCPLLMKDIDVVFPSASMIKVLIMETIFNEIILNRWSKEKVLTVLDEDLVEDTLVAKDYSTLELIDKMITESNNVATNVLIKTFGFDLINERAKQLHLKDTSLNRMMLDFKAIEAGRNNYTSQADLCLLFKTIFKHSPAKDEMLKILKAQKDQRFIKRYMDLDFRHKTGDLNGLVHDGGILYLNDKHYYFGLSIYNPNSRSIDYNQVGRFAKQLLKEYL